MRFGVYLLIRNHIVVYVGQTHNIKKRLKSHKNKVWDRYHFFECHPDLLNYFEERLVDRFRPEYNKALKHPYSSLHRKLQINKEINMAKRKIWRIQNGKQS